MSTTASVVSVAGRLAIASPARTVSRVKESFILWLRIDKIVLGVGRNDSLKKLLLIFLTTFVKHPIFILFTFIYLSTLTTISILARG